MVRAHAGASQGRFAAFVDRLARTLHHADRRDPLRLYLTGLLLPGERKSVEPMAARLDPRHVSARHQSLHHFVADAPWPAGELLRSASDYVLSEMERHGPVAAWVVDDTGMPKKGRHSVGVSRQYCGALGKQDNCQVAVSVSLANAAVSVPCAYRLYLPESWAESRPRRREARIPPEVTFRTKWQIAIEQLDELLADQLPRAPVVADSGYGDTTAFREALTARGLPYMVGIKGETSLWPPGVEPLAPARWRGRGRPPILVRRDSRHSPVAAREIAMTLPATAWKTVRWREGTRGRMSARCAALRARPAHRDNERARPRDFEWLVVEWPRGECEPTKYWLSTANETVSLQDLVALAKIRWRIERDFQELKDEIGLDHYEGRSWRGFHHHGALCIAAYAFLAAERARLSPPAPLAFLRPARLPKGFQPRGAARAS
jgi:SRSO17 transposase